MCGERLSFLNLNSWFYGSSPRVRGTVGDDTIPQRGFRFIPACAGNGTARGRSAPGYAVHPRVCGERAHVEHLGGNLAGSSPRVRGTVGKLLHRDIPVRFIPACAGNGLRQPTGRHSMSVHPRVCGERRYLDRRRKQGHGSSPRVRGTGRSGCPARRTPSVHPRVCGERFSPYWQKSANFGSSPRVRGTVSSGGSRCHGRRFIPACAGNGLCSNVVAAEPAVHPRVCGERNAVARQAVQGQRFIPACAGNGKCLVICIPDFDGSSPRVRGTG